MPIELTLNGKPQRINVAPNLPLLWVLRDSAAQCHFRGDAAAYSPLTDPARGPGLSLLSRGQPNERR